MSPVRVCVWLMVLLLAACSSPGVKDVGDGPPSRDIDVSQVPDAMPRVEPITAAGNKSPYQVFGRTYRVKPTSAGYSETGLASWYGTKFHGRKTSNGEIYDMYAMTAAHKSLPIPAYVRVTNLENGKQVIVRVNDRGPFHGDRIIDLSYAAAKRLGFHDQGVAEVEVVAIDPATYQRNSVQTPSMVGRDSEPVEIDEDRRPPAPYRLPANTYLQAGAFSSKQAAEDKAERLASVIDHPLEVREERRRQGTLFKVLIGPVTDNSQLLDLRSLLHQSENIRSFVVYQ